MAQDISSGILEDHRIIVEEMDDVIRRAGIAPAMEDAATNITDSDTGTVTGASTTTTGTGPMSGMTGPIPDISGPAPGAPGTAPGSIGTATTGTIGTTGTATVSSREDGIELVSDTVERFAKALAAHMEGEEAVFYPRLESDMGEPIQGVRREHGMMKALLRQMDGNSREDPRAAQRPRRERAASPQRGGGGVSCPGPGRCSFGRGKRGS